jgi:CRISPR-associated protein Cas5h
MSRLISFDIKTDFGFLKKPDINEGIYLTYNLLHKPALLGILGAIIGLKGYKKTGEFPEYYRILKHIKISIKPLNHYNGGFNKIVIYYNNSVGYANQAEGGNLLIYEQTLIKPSYCCFVEIDENNDHEVKLAENLSKYNAEYIPYMGKNDFSLWWENFNEYKYEKFNYDFDFKIMSLFKKPDSIKNEIYHPITWGNWNNSEKLFTFFERLPNCFNEEMIQYILEDFTYTNFTFRKDSAIKNLYKLNDQDELIQLY